MGRLLFALLLFALVVAACGGGSSSNSSGSSASKAPIERELVLRRARGIAETDEVVVPPELGR